MQTSFSHNCTKINVYRIVSLGPRRMENNIKFTNAIQFILVEESFNRINEGRSAGRTCSHGTEGIRFAKEKLPPEACNHGLYDLNHIRYTRSADSNQHLESWILLFSIDQLSQQDVIIACDLYLYGKKVRGKHIVEVTNEWMDPEILRQRQNGHGCSPRDSFDLERH